MHSELYNIGQTVLNEANKYAEVIAKALEDAYKLGQQEATTKDETSDSQKT